MNKKVLIWISVLLGILFVLLALMYWFTKAGSLPTYFPGYIAGSTIVHFKHGLASLILALALFAFAWFSSGKKSSK
jgi:ammonia channel protein AmtB